MGKIIGIDLGTSNSAAAVLSGGKPEIIPSAEGNTLGGKAFPSVVAFTKDGQRLVGEPARRQAISNPDKTITAIKRKMGTSYTVKIDGKEYTSPENKDVLLQELSDDLNDLQMDLANAEEESVKYSGGLLGVLSLTQVETVKNSIAFLNQRRLLLKHDIPYYDIVPAPSTNGEPDFMPTPGEDINKF